MTIENNTNAVMLILARNDFYRRLHFLALGAFFLSLIIIAVLSFILYFLITNPVQPVFFAADNIGRLIHVPPLTAPAKSDDEVAKWAVEAAEALLSYDYLNYQRQLQSAQKYFTDYGWHNAMKSLTQSNNLNGLKRYHWIVLARAVEKPKLLNKGLLGGAFAWRFEFPVLINFWSPPYDDKSKLLNPWVIKVIVQRQPILKSYQGLGIVQLIAEQAYQAPSIPAVAT